MYFKSYLVFLNFVAWKYNVWNIELICVASFSNQTKHFFSKLSWMHYLIEDTSTAVPPENWGAIFGIFVQFFFPHIIEIYVF